MKKRLVYRADINWGWLPLVIALLVVVIDIMFLYFFLQYILLFLRNELPFAFGVILIALPLFALTYMVSPILKALFLQYIKRTEFQLYTTGMKVKDKYLKWSNIKSISFNTGRYKDRVAFFRGPRLPALQKIYVLDKKGVEYSCVIDIDYSTKKNRKDNNLRKIREFLLGMDKVSLLSDWAQKR